MKISLRPTLPLKYLIDAHIVLLSYPTKQDFIFDVLSYIVKVSLAKSKIIDPKDIKFSIWFMLTCHCERMRSNPNYSIFSLNKFNIH